MGDQIGQDFGQGKVQCRSIGQVMDTTAEDLAREDQPTLRGSGAIA